MKFGKSRHHVKLWRQESEDKWSSIRFLKTKQCWKIMSQSQDQRMKKNTLRTKIN